MKGVSKEVSEKEMQEEEEEEEGRKIILKRAKSPQ